MHYITLATDYDGTIARSGVDGPTRERRPAALRA